MVTLTNQGWTRTASPTSARAGKAMPPDPSCQPCPDCGGLTCLCRPRFFAGQLLTEQDLNRLDQYITGKHKLHNRYLWGWGVVGGLEVSCSPCDGLVRVSEGYALSPCGEDIVVCKDDSVDICALIARCRTDSEPDCRPYARQEQCDDVIEDWILAVRYAESPSRGVTALTGAGQSCGCSGGSSCGGSCGCSGGSGCGCSPGAAKAATPAPRMQQPRLNRGAPPSCEPTLTCETYRYDVFKAPEKPGRDPKDDNQRGFSGVAGLLEGDMFARIECCLKEFEAVLPAAPGDPEAIQAQDRQAWFNWCCRTRTALATYLARIGGSNCEAIERLGAVVCPVPSQPLDTFQAAMQDAFAAYVVIVLEAMIGCFCSAALPPVRAPGDPRVPLAVVKVRRRDCKVISVCNWTPHRQHVLTFNTLDHWFGWIPLARLLRDVMHRVCCDLFGLRNLFEPDRQPRPQDGQTPVTEAPTEAQPAPNPPPPPPFGMIAVPMRMTAPPPEQEQEKLEARMKMDDRVPISPFDGLKARTGVFEATAMRALQDREGTRIGDIMAAVFTRPQLGIDETLGPKDRRSDIARAAATPQMGVLGGMASPLLRGIAALAGGAGAALQPGKEGADMAAQLAELKAGMAAQSAELAALRKQIGPAAAQKKRTRKPQS